MSLKRERIDVYNMTCTSCEKRVETAIKKLDGVTDAKASFSGQYVDIEYDSEACNTDKVKTAIKDAGYSVKKDSNFNFIGIAVIAAAIILLGMNTNSFDMGDKLNNASYFVLFVVGLLTSIHCLGMCGGIMLSQSISEEGGSKFKAIIPTLLYNMGRVVSYTILGGIVGAIGSVISPSIGFKAGLQLIAGIFMVIMGLNMSGFSIFRKLNLTLPWSGCSIKRKARTPFVIGLLNGFMPCGPLQTMQLYALGTGSAVKGALSMFLFALGTVPLMLAFGAVSGLLSRGYTKKLLKFSGILVVVLGLIMGSRGLALAGVGFPSIASAVTQKQSANVEIVKPVIENGVQIITMSANSRGYTPNVLFVQKGTPVKWIINGDQLTSCNNAVVIPSLNIEKKLGKGENIIEFTPGDKDIRFSCWMGMISGVIKVVDNIDSIDGAAVGDTPPPSSGSSCCGGAPVQTDSIYGNDLSTVATERLVRKADVAGTIQTISIKGIGYEFDPLIIVVKKDVKTKLNIDLNEFDAPEGQYIIVGESATSPSATFEGAKGVASLDYTFDKTGGYGIIKDSNVLAIIEVVDDITNVDLQKIRDKYIR